MRLANRLVIGVVLAAAAAGAPATADEVPKLDRTTEITAAGHRVITVSVGAGETLRPGDLDLDVSGGRFAFAGLSQVACRVQGRLCFGGTVLRLPELADGPDDRLFHDGEFHYTQDEGRWPSGLYDIFIVTDGSARLTIRPSGGSGTTQNLVADKPANARLIDLTTTCPQAPTVCRSLSYGGASHPVAAPGFAAAIAYAGSPRYTGTPRPSAFGVTACLSPSNSAGDGASRSHGCIHDDASSPDRVVTEGVTAIDVLTGQVVVSGGWNIHAVYNNVANGNVYAGYAARQFSPTGLDSARLRAFGMWIDAQESA